jgi:hypothetical protein
MSSIPLPRASEQIIEDVMVVQGSVHRFGTREPRIRAFGGFAVADILWKNFATQLMKDHLGKVTWRG